MTSFLAAQPLSRLSTELTSPVQREDYKAATTEELLDLLATEAAPATHRRIYALLARRHRGLVVAIASHYRGCGIEWDDLVQVGRVGLCKAILGYRRNSGASFRAYAIPTITGEIKRAFRDHGWQVRPPRRLQELQLDLRDKEGRLSQELGRSPTNGELADAMGLDEKDLQEVRIAGRTFATMPLDTLGWETRCDRLAARDRAYDLVDARLTLHDAIEVLNGNERRMIYLRFIRGMTQQEIGDELGIGQMQVSRKLHRILSKLRSRVEPRLQTT